MKKTLLTVAVVMATITFCNAQKIEIEKKFGGYQYTMEGKTMSMGEIVTAIESNKEAVKLMKKARRNNTISSILGGAGGALIGFPIGQTIGGGDANWALAGVGAGLIVVAIPISSSGNKRAKEAVDLYNASLNPTSFYDFKPVFKFISKTDGIGLFMSF